MKRSLDALVDVMRVPLVGDPANAVIDTPAMDDASEIEAEVLVVGGGVGGVAAAWAAARRGRCVYLTEETDWIGGQLTAQGVSALDEHEHIESFGGTRTYYQLREAIRDHYRKFTEHPDRHLNPGNCWVTRLAFEPRVALRALEGLLAPQIEAGRLNVLLRTKAAAAEVRDDQVISVTMANLDNGGAIRFRPQIVIDATELGDLLPLTGTEYVVGAEAIHETGEPHAQPHQPKSRCVQSFTYTFALERCPDDQRHVIARPAKYEHYRDGQPYSFNIHVHGGEIYSEQTRWLEYQMFEQAPATKGGLWTYRRLIDHARFAGRFPADITMFNWPGNDYRDESILDRPAGDVAAALQDAKRVSMGFLHWLQTEAPHPNGKDRGFGNLKLRKDVMAGGDGLCKYPYIRESRRIKALKTVVEQEVSADHQQGPRAAPFGDSVGLGWYPIDIHRAGPADVGVSCRTRPFQIPLGALIAVRMTNLIAAAKNIGTTHITNGCYRLHPVEWNIGEAAGMLAAEALDHRCTPRTVHEDPSLLRTLQQRLVADGVPLYWFVDVPISHRAFEALQLLATGGVVEGEPDSLEFRPDDPLADEDRIKWTAGEALALQSASESTMTRADYVIARRDRHVRDDERS